MSIEEIERISLMNHENKQAQLRGDPAPHQISQDDLVRALRSIRAMRATGSQRPASKKSSGAASSGTTTKAINLDDF